MRPRCAGCKERITRGEPDLILRRMLEENPSGADGKGVLLSTFRQLESTLDDVHETATQSGRWSEEWATERVQGAFGVLRRHFPEILEGPRRNLEEHNRKRLEKHTEAMREAVERNDPKAYTRGLRGYIQVAGHQARWIRKRRAREARENPRRQR